MVQALIDRANPYGRAATGAPTTSDDVDESAIDTVRRARRDDARRRSTAFIMLGLGGAISRVGEDDTALSGRNVPFNCPPERHLGSRRDDEANIAWVRGDDRRPIQP